MSELYEKSLLKLELDQVLSLLADCAGSFEGKKACMVLHPSSDLDVVKELLEETTAASNLAAKKEIWGFLMLRMLRQERRFQRQEMPFLSPLSML